MAERALQGKSIAMVISFRNFRDVEYFVPQNVLKAAGAEITTISSERGVAVGADGGEAQVDLEADEAEPENFEAVLFIGGPGMAKKLDDESFQRLAQETVSKDKVTGAICIATALLAKAGVLNGKKAAVWSSAMDKSAVKILEENGAIYQKKPVVSDGKIITADGPDAAEKFARTIVEILK